MREPVEDVLQPRLRRLLAAVPTRPLRRAVWDRVKHWRRTGTVETVFAARLHCDTRDFIQRFVHFFGTELVVEVAQGRLAARGHGVAARLESLRARGFRTYVLENAYRGRAYLYANPIERPARFERRCERQCDVVFARVDAGAL